MKKEHSEEFVMLNNYFIGRNHGGKDKKSGLFLVRSTSLNYILVSANTEFIHFFLGIIRGI